MRYLFLTIAPFVLLYTYWFANVFAGIGKDEVFCDEPGWVTSAYVYTDLVLTGNVGHEQWKQQECGYFGDLNPLLGKLILGVPLVIYSNFYNHGHEWRGLWESGKSTEWNRAHGHVPPDAILSVARLTVAVISFILSILMLWITWFVWGRATALVYGFLLLVATPLFARNCALAMTDQIYLLFLYLGVATGLYIMRTTKYRHLITAVTLFGLFAGLATSVKVTGLLVLSPLVFVLEISLYSAKTFSGAKLLCAGGIYIFSVLATIYSLNPFYWASISNLDPASLFKEVYRAAWLKEPVAQEHKQPESTWSLLTSATLKRDEIRKAYPQLSRAILPPAEFFLLFPRWKKAFREIAEGGGNIAPFAPPGSLEIVRSISLGPYPYFPIFRVLLMIGLIVSGWELWAGTHQRRCVILPVFAFFFIQLGFLLFTMPVSFDRYYLPAVLAARIFVAVGCVKFLRTVWGAYAPRLGA